MANKSNFVVLILIFIPSLLFSQKTVIIKPDGSIEPFNQNEVLPIQKAKLIDKSLERGSHQLPLGAEGLIDTVYQTDFGWGTYVRFNFYGHDVMIQWFKAPADMTLKSVGFSEGYADAGDNVGTEVSVKIVIANWTEEEFIAATTTQAPARWGWFSAPGNGYNDAAPLMEDPDGNIYDTWVVVDSSHMTPPWSMDIWSDAGMGALVTVDPLNAPAPDDKFYYWVDMSLLQNEPQFQAGELFGIVVTNSSPTMDDNNVLLWACNDAVPYGAFKYYANERNPGLLDYGWWSRLYAWDMAYVAEIYSPPILYIEVTSLKTTLSTDPQTVIAIVHDDNPGGTSVASVHLLWSTDGMTSWDSTAMVNTTGNEYTADIPGQSPGTIIDYYVKATDFNGNVSASPIFQYRIFQASGAPTLLVFNGYTTETGYPQSYYFGIGDTVNYTTYPFWHDTWAFGPLTMELLNYYNNVLEITTSGPREINSDTIATWLAASEDRNYMLAGDEWLGAQTGWVNRTYSAGTFQYDILGITADFNDVNWGQSGDELLPSPVFPIAGSLLGDSLEWKRIEVGVEQDSMMYDPNYEITQLNWLDGVDVLGDVAVDLKGVGVTGDTFNIAIHRTLSAGNKIAFLAYDPLSLNAFGTQYYWFGFSSTAPQVQVLKWFGADTLTAIKKDEQIPSQFFLSQNYPNPFNPTTTIEYSIATSGKVHLTVYDVLGREIANLVNTHKKPGKYTVNFDGRQHASGLYFYKLIKGDKTVTRKMLSIK